MRAPRSSPLAIIFLTVFIDLVGFGIVIPVLPLYAQQFGASPVVIGALFGVYSLMQAIAAPLLGRVSDRVGRRPVLLLSLIGTAAGFLLMGWAKTLPLLFLARIVDGVTGGNISTAQAYIADITRPEDRSRGMGLIGAAFGLGFIFGPAIGGVLSHVSLSAPFFFAAALAAANACALYLFLPESLPPAARGVARRRPSLVAVFREDRTGKLPLIIGAYFCTTAAFSLLTATYPLFTSHHFGFGAAHNGYLFAALGVVGAVVQGTLMGRLVRTFGDKRLIVAGVLFLALSLFVLPFSRTTGSLIMVTGAIAVGHSLIAAPINGLASRDVGAAVQGQVLGIMQSAASIARIIGPAAGGVLLQYDLAHAAEQFGRTAYWTGGAVMGAALLLAALL